jgi:hypothetical protein
LSGDSVAIFPPGSDGNAKPSAVISGANTKLASPSAIAVDSSENIYVTNEGGPNFHCNPHCSCGPAGLGNVAIYAPGSNGDVTPIATISGPHTKLQIPYGIALDSNRNIYVLNAMGSFEVCSYLGGGPDLSQGLEIQNYVDTITGPILIFAAGSNGDIPPIGSFGGPFTGLYGPAGIAVGPGGP